MDKFNILDNGIKSVFHFKSRDEILAFLDKNPM